MQISRATSDFRGLTFENWFQWAEEADDASGFNGGIRASYTFVDGGGPDEAQVRLTLTDKFADGWEWRANLIGEVETGEGSEGRSGSVSLNRFRGWDKWISASVMLRPGLAAAG